MSDSKKQSLGTVKAPDTMVLDRTTSPAQHRRVNKANRKRQPPSTRQKKDLINLGHRFRVLTSSLSWLFSVLASTYLLNWDRLLFCRQHGNTGGERRVTCAGEQRTWMCMRRIGQHVLMATEVNVRR